MFKFFDNQDKHDEFLPAALEVLDRPPSPLGRTVAFVICFIFLFVVVWSTIGKVDVVIVGQGKVIPTGQVKTVQPFEAAVVKSIAVIEGEYVSKGQVLIELDPTDTSANVESLNTQYTEAWLDLTIAQSLIAGDPRSTFVNPVGVATERTNEAYQQAISLYANYLSTIDDLDSQEIQLQTQLNENEIQQQQIEQSLPILKKRLRTSGTLLSKEAMTQDSRLALQQSYIDMSASLAQLHQNKQKTIAQIRSIKAQRNQVISNFQSSYRVQEREARTRMMDLQSQSTTENQRNTYRTLVAPASGYVDQLTIHTVGGTVQPGQAVLNIVPDLETLEVEAFVLNKDIGFIKMGDPTEIKLEAFPFTRYGVLEGTITNISNDAVNNEQLGLVYKIKSSINTSAEAMEATNIKIAPGMSTTVEILTEKRRVIEYFISPILRYQDEAIRER